MGARSELLALIRHAKEDPDDVPRRLVLADWLEEHGDDADRVRASALRGSPPGREDPRWFGRLSALGDASLGPDGFTGWRVPGRTLLRADAAALGEPFNWVASLEVTSVTGMGLGRLVQSGLLDGAVSVDVRGPPVGTEGAIHLSRLPATALLRHLSLHDQHVRHAGVKQLVRARIAPRLRSLVLTGCQLWPESLAELAAAPFPELRRLVIGSRHLGDAAAHLIRADWLRSLRHLGLAWCNLDDRAVARLLLEGDLSSLITLGLSSNRIGPRSVAALVGSPTLTSLTELDLSHTNVGEAVPALAEWPGLRRLRVLRLRIPLHGRAFSALASSPHLDRIELLELWDPQPPDTPEMRALRGRFVELFGERLLLTRG